MIKSRDGLKGTELRGDGEESPDSAIRDISSGSEAFRSIERSRAAPHRHSTVEAAREREEVEKTARLFEMGKEGRKKETRMQWKSVECCLPVTAKHRLHLTCPRVGCVRHVSETCGVDKIQWGRRVVQLTVSCLEEGAPLLSS
jgi:hypothetical protein